MTNTVTFADFISNGEEKINFFETAAWSETITLRVGEFPIEGKITDDGQVKDAISFSVPGTIKNDYLQSLSGGMPIGEPYDQLKNTGKPASWKGFTYAHAIAKNLVEGTLTNIRLRPGFEARRIDFGWGGKPCHTYGIFKV
jgi:hypothetical protein